jgi:hypothetical protein
MHNGATNPARSSSGRNPMRDFRVVTAYEDFTMAGKATGAYEFLTANLTCEWHVSNRMWKFELLGLPELRQIAAEDAVMADLIFVACDGAGDLPGDVKTWMQMWHGHGTEAVALVALFGCPPDRATQTQVTQAYLEDVAQRARVDFFAWPQVCLRQRNVPQARRILATDEALLRAA